MTQDNPHLLRTGPHFTLDELREELRTIFRAGMSCRTAIEDGDLELAKLELELCRQSADAVALLAAKLGRDCTGELARNHKRLMDANLLVVPLPSDTAESRERS